MKNLRLILLIVSVVLSSTTAATFSAEGPPLSTAIQLDEILLKDGNMLLGTIVEELPDMVIFKTESLGRLEIPRGKIEKLAHGEEVEGALADPDQNSIMFCPTPASLAKGDSYFRDFELLVLNFGFGVTDYFDLSFGTFFPVSSELLMFSVGGKLRLLDRDKQAIGLALTGGFTKMEELHFGTAGAVVGIGNSRKSLNLAINRTFNDDGDFDTVFIAGADMQVSRRSKFFAEYLSSSELLKNEDVNGFVNIGIRIFGKSHSFSLSGFRPLSSDTGSFLAFPMVSYSVHW